ncbi:hypothetical protein BGZ61DRAFT_141989 [Ilyonectria robusta]|uniref:uncharacterized protein n=1 Tax=Ilyonectria robusta TaxID=1079257 RepID=UPI001E8E1782|nr:uncharacterized protein BGZ61DRAFT_141989 [Ilyonectria robusta]KAH8663784.1 hypothetical protein BGZ61DRAFT_141989 [Ilyonectria robusta]
MCISPSSTSSGVIGRGRRPSLAKNWLSKTKGGYRMLHMPRKEDEYDHARPACSFCRPIGAQCRYDARDASSFDRASLKILDRLSVIETSVREKPISSTLPPDTS